MTRRDHALLTALVVGGLLLTLYQCWYISLPLQEASEFDVCRFSPSLNCLRSLHAFGEDMRVWMLPVIPAIAALFWFQTFLCAFAWTTTRGPHEAWLGLARIVSFPASGLATYVLLHDFFAAKATSVSAILVAILSLTISSLTVLHGLSALNVKRGWQLSASLGAGALLLIFLVDGTIGARRETDRVQRARLEAQPQVRWPDFARSVPRTGAASLGDVTAPAELLLFLDPDEESSRALMRELPELATRFGARVRIVMFASGEAGPRLIQAQRTGSLLAYLAGPKTAATRPPTPADRALATRQEEAWRRIDIEELPAAVWSGGRRSGNVRLREILDTVAKP